MSGKTENKNNAALNVYNCSDYAGWRCFCKVETKKPPTRTAIGIFVFMLAKHFAKPIFQVVNYNATVSD